MARWSRWTFMSARDSYRRIWAGSRAILDLSSAILYTGKVSLLAPPAVKGESMQSRSLQASLRIALVLVAACFAIAAAHAQNPTHVISGTVEKVDAGAKTIAVKTADGTVETVKFTEKTTVHGLKEGAKGADLAGKEGGHVIVHATGEGAEKTAHSVEWFGDKTVRTTEGTVEDVGEGSKTVAVKTADGTKEAFEVSEHATVDTGKDVGRYSAVGAKKGEHVTVYYTEEAGKKVAHLFKHL